MTAMMIFKLYLCEDVSHDTEIAQTDLTLSDSDYINIFRKVKKYVENTTPAEKKNPFLMSLFSILIPVLAHENIVAFVCGFLQTKGNKRKIIDLVNSLLEERDLFFRLSDYVIQHKF